MASKTVIFQLSLWLIDFIFVPFIVYRSTNVYWRSKGFVNRVIKLCIRPILEELFALILVPSSNSIEVIINKTTFICFIGVLLLNSRKNRIVFVN